MPYIYLDKRKKPHVYRFQYTDARGLRRTATGTTSKSETLEIALLAEAKERAVRKGWADEKAPPTTAELSAKRSYAEVVEEYLAWGSAQGGIGGRPWAPAHLEKREEGLEWWGKQLKLDDLGDLNGCLPRVEKVLRALLTKGLSTLWIISRASCLKAFCKWCKRRSYLAMHPLEELSPFERKAQKIRRALTVEEVQKLLEHCRPRRKLLYLVAIASGLRANALRNLRVRNLDLDRGGIVIESWWAKNRKDAFLPLNRTILSMLAEQVAGKPLDTNLLKVGTQPARDLATDMMRAGLKVDDDLGKVDFHALRVAYTTLALEAGANPKELQALGQWHNADLPLKVYARTRDARLEQLAETIGTTVLASLNGSGKASTEPPETSEGKTSIPGADDGQGRKGTSKAKSSQAKHLEDQETDLAGVHGGGTFKN